MIFSKSIKRNPKAYIAFKSKGNPQKISQYQNAYSRIKSLAILDEEKYIEVHGNLNDLDYILHYLYYGVNDTLEVQQSYTSDIFNLEFYKNTYNVLNPILDYVLDGFFKNNNINILDNNYINTLEIPLFEQYFSNEKTKVEKIVNDSYYIMDKKTLIPYIQRENPIEMDSIRVGVFTNDPFENLAPCPYIRLHGLFSELSKSEKYTFFMYGMDSFVMMDIDNILRCRLFDVVVVQRILPFLDVLREKCQRYGIKLVYETDDDLLGVEENSPSYEYVTRVSQSINDIIDASDVITVTTPTLASKFDKNKTVIISNYYVNSVFDIKDDIKREGKLKLGYYGTLTHTKDLFLIKNVILKLKEKYDFDFEIIGGFNASDNVDEDWFKPVQLPPNNMDFEKFMPWLADTVDWDIALVPLENSSFNQCKSELKFIELAVLGIPGVFSNMCVYNNVVKDGFDGFLANDEDEWVEKIENLILDASLRENIRNNALTKVLNEYTIEDRIKLWDDILSK
ncbi:MAG: glycosyltransferase [Methanobrevibacter sp.]|uniref:glycosyltransferase family protein n=1 Tax=Methanobrevibacter sp. TaxID=66852 RepID=UPI0025FF8131|nr:glycosyltransferase [Methanobrevibacter sp.]MBR0270960.1 glycosyltransferase [Methanobrevibacter sp.]